MSHSPVQLRLLTAKDIPFAMELKNLAGWNQTEEDWNSYLSYEKEGCFLAEAEGERAGTATAITYEDRFGWVGMVLVHPSKRRLGIGTELLKQAIQYTQNAGVGCVKLDATPMGKKVYIPLGFVDEYDLRRYQGKGLSSNSRSETAAVADDPAVQPIPQEAIGDITAFDRYYFGASRGNVLRTLSLRNKQYSLYIKDESGVAGYIMAHQGFEALQIGPWIAKDALTAEKLFIAVLNRVPEQKVFLDVPCPNKEAIQLMEKYGFEVQRGFCRMYYGDNKYPGLPEGIYGTSGAEKG